MPNPNIENQPDRIVEHLPRQDEIEEKSFDEMNFTEALASAAQEKRLDVIKGLLIAAGKGEPSAIKILSNAVMENQFNEEAKFIIPDERYKQIITISAEAISSGEI